MPLLAAAGVAFLVAGAAAWARTPEAAPDDVGSASGARPWPVPIAIYPSRAPDAGGRDAALGVVPVSVRLPGSAAAAVVPQGAASSGELGLPDDVAAVGWWSGGAGAGAARGSAVLAGHVDAASQGVGYFARLRGLGPGDRVVVRGADGRERSYAVTGRRSYRKESLPGELFDPGGPPRLVLVTCTGDFDARTRSYADNLVVYAAPAP